VTASRSGKRSTGFSPSFFIGGAAFFPTSGSGMKIAAIKGIK